jgi:hypothetical protein
VATALIWHSAAFVVITALILLLVVRARLHFRWRLALAILAGAAYLAHYSGLNALTGWPTGTSLPAEFDVLGTRVVEPGRGSNAPGHIELWIREPGNRDSRLFTIPYEPAAHEEASRAQQRLAEGRRQRGRPASSSGSDGQGSVVIEDKPPPRLPSKRRN